MREGYKQTEVGRIPEEWEVVRLLDVLDFIIDNRGKTAPTSDNGIPLIATNCIKNETLFPIYEKVRYVTRETYRNWFRSHPKPGDIIFVNKGTPGRVCFVPDPVDFCIAQDMVALHVNKEVITNKYLFAALRSPAFQRQVESFHVGTMIPHCKKGDFEKLTIPLPPLHVQKTIGDFYYSLSYKIELNNQINKTLEDMAQAIFKSWFIDFEPFRDGEFVDSELGRIPKGWEVRRFTDFVDVLSGGTPKTKEPTYWDGDIPFFTPKDATDSYYVHSTQKYITELGLSKCNSKLYPRDTVFITARGTVGKVCLSSVDMAMNQSCYALQGKTGFNQLFVFLMTKHCVQQIKHTASGAVFDAIVVDTFKSIKAVVPPVKHIKVFNEAVVGLFDQIRANKEMNQTLAKLRDTLLPKLMSGEIRVPTDA